MKIEPKKLYINKTWRFLVPSMRYYGEEFTERYSKIFKVAVGIQDYATLRYKNRQPLLYTLVNKEINSNCFRKNIQWLKQQYYFVADYPFAFDWDLDLHMIVLKIPKRHHQAYKHFINGQYSEMYDKDYSELLFSSKKRKADYEILKQTPQSFKDFKLKVDQFFKVDIDYKDFINVEMELPLVIKEEVFNPELKPNHKDCVFFKPEKRKILF